MVFARVFIAVFLLVFITSMVVTFILPETYAGTSQIMLKSNKATIHGEPPTYDPYSIQTAIEVIQSQSVLEPVIEELDLNEIWGKKYNAGVKLKTADTLQLLKQRLELAPVGNTMIVSIKVYSEDRDEAAQIANEIPKSYVTYLYRDDKLTNNSPSAPLLVEIAKPGNRPVRPNKPLNIVVGAVAGILLGSIAGGIIARLVSASGRKSVKA